MEAIAMKKWLSILVVIMSFLVPQAAIAARELIDPPAVTVPDSVKPAEVAKIIKTSLVNRGWIVEKDSANQISAGLYVRQHVLKVAISYTATEVKLTYVSSQNLDYKEKDGKRYIHRKYAGWTTKIMSDITKGLQLATLD
jgi:hypothetical protein